MSIDSSYGYDFNVQLAGVKNGIVLPHTDDRTVDPCFLVPSTWCEDRVVFFEDKFYRFYGFYKPIGRVITVHPKPHKAMLDRIREFSNNAE